MREMRLFQQVLCKIAVGHLQRMEEMNLGPKAQIHLQWQGGGFKPRTS